MKFPVLGKIGIFAAALLLMMAAPLFAYAQTVETGNPPPVEQPLLREGTLAVQLVSALGLQNTSDEVTAETILGNAGITPRNGWIADYPVTPDIIEELRQAIVSAADAGRIPLDSAMAMQKLDYILASLGISTSPYTGGEVPAYDEYSPEQASIDNYYYDQGPPIITYYSPPSDFYYLYTWVPYPFWCDDFWFPGYFILNDFDRTIVVDHDDYFVTNHFHNRRFKGYHRIDADDRLWGKTYAGIGVPNHGGFVTAVPGAGGTRAFNPDENNRHGRTPHVTAAETEPMGRHREFRRHERGNEGIFARHEGGTANHSGFFSGPGSGVVSPMRREGGRPENFTVPRNRFNAPVQSFNPPPRSFTHTVRSFAAPPQSFNPPARSFNPPPRSFNIPQRSFNPAPRTFNVPQREFTAPARNFSEAPRSFPAPGGGFSPHPAETGGFGSFHGGEGDFHAGDRRR